MTPLQILHCTISATDPIWGSDNSGRPQKSRSRTTAKDENMTSMRQSFKNWRKFRNTYNELNRMSDRELSDIGMTRGDIPFVARQAK